MPAKPPAKKAAKKTAKKKVAKKIAKKVAKKKAPNTQLTIDLPPADQLALNVQRELVKLPSQAVHNHLHRLGEQARIAREQLQGVEIVAPILCALELEHQKSNHGCPWREWVKLNCEFSYETARKYAKVLKHARAGDIKDLDSALIPNTPPSLMSAKELQETCESLANALQGYRGIRQLYLELEVIKTPQKNTIDDNRLKKVKKPNSKDSDSDKSVVDLELKRKDVTHTYRDALQRLDQAVDNNQHIHLHPETIEEIILSLTEHANTLKNL